MKICVLPFRFRYTGEKWALWEDTLRKLRLISYGKRLLTLAIPAFCCIGTSFAAPPLSVYGNLAGFETAALSASGEKIALIGIVEEKRRLIVVNQAKQLLFTANLGDIKVRDIDWAGENLVLLETSNTVSLGLDFTATKTELTGMTVIPVNGGKLWSVFAHSRLITGGIRGFHGLNQRDGNWFGYFGGITLESDGKTEPYLRSADPVLYEVNLQTQQSRKIANRTDDQDNYRSWIVAADGKVGATLDYYSRDGQWFIRNGSGKRIADGINKLGGIRLIGFGTSGDTIIYEEEDVDDGEEHWFEVPTLGEGAKEILKDESIRRSIFDKRNHRLVGYEIDADVPAYHFYDPYRQKVITAALKAFPNLSVHLIDWNDHFDRLLVMTEGVEDPQTWWIIDIKTGEATDIGISYPMAGRDVAPMRMIQYKAADGKNIAAVLTLPPGHAAKNLPVIVFPHGGPAARDYPGFDWWAQALASRGYAILQPNFRGSTGYGTDFERAGHGEWGRKMQSDISEGLAQLVKDGIVDGKRACIMGASYGGYAALAGVTLQKGLYRCAVSVGGVSDVQKMALTDISESGSNATIRRGLKEEVGSGRDLRAVSPVRYAAAADAPILLIHGKDDVVVNYDQSNDMAAALRKAGKPVEFVTLQGEDHWLSKSATRLAMLQATVAFIEKYNPPDPEK